jgi:hypothetical protein
VAYSTSQCDAILGKYLGTASGDNVSVVRFPSAYGDLHDSIFLSCKQCKQSLNVTDACVKDYTKEGLLSEVITKWAASHQHPEKLIDGWVNYKISYTTIAGKDALYGFDFPSSIEEEIKEEEVRPEPPKRTGRKFR